jgi:hypothetical protein
MKSKQAFKFRQTNKNKSSKNDSTHCKWAQLQQQHPQKVKKGKKKQQTDTT